MPDRGLARARITIDIVGVGPVQGVVRWAQSGKFGIQFGEQFDLARLAPKRARRGETDASARGTSSAASSADDPKAVSSSLIWINIQPLGRVALKGDDDAGFCLIRDAGSDGRFGAGVGDDHLPI